MSAREWGWPLLESAATAIQKLAIDAAKNGRHIAEVEVSRKSLALSATEVDTARLRFYGPRGAIRIRLSDAVEPGVIVAHHHMTPEAFERAERNETELAETRAILADLLEERGESWLAQLVGRREELACVVVSWTVEGFCRTCGTHQNMHTADCFRADLARIVGGAEETQRQVDAAHAVALKGAT
jgi:hypothetical protein